MSRFLPVLRPVLVLTAALASALTGWNDGSGYPGRLMADDWWIFEFGD
jgi:hypothetical protein